MNRLAFPILALALAATTASAVSSVRGTVWEDCNLPNGKFDEGEATQAGLKVKLYSCSGEGGANLAQRKIGQVTTDEFGVFEFNDIPDDVLYITARFRRMARAAQTNGITSTDGSENVATNDVASDRQSECVPVGVNMLENGSPAADQRLDFGYCSPGDSDTTTRVSHEVSGAVFQDCYPMNGVFDKSTETFVPDIRVELFTCAAPDTPKEDRVSTGRVTRTDSIGTYRFGSIDPSVAYVSVRFTVTKRSWINALSTSKTDDKLLNDVDEVGKGGIAWTPCQPPTRRFPSIDQDADLGFCPPCPGDFKACYDPHFTGFLGQRFEFHGHSGHVYNIVSSPHLQYNARFNQTKYKHNGVPATFITEMGLLIGPQGRRVRVAFVEDNNVPVLKVEVDGVDVPPYVSDERVDLSDDGTEFLFRMGDDGVGVYISTRDFVFHIRGELRQYNHINDGLKLANWHPDFVAHGLLGQTGQPGHAAKETREAFADIEWPAFLDGQASDYDQGADIFGTSSRFNMFDGALT